MSTGESKNTATDSYGRYEFSKASNGAYRIIYSKYGYNARISNAVLMNGKDLVIDETNFVTGNNYRILMVRLAGLPNQNPQGTIVKLGNFSLNAPNNNATDHFWYKLGDGYNDEIGGVGIVTASSPGYSNKSATVTSSNYVLNNVAIITLDFSK
jgi:hypothetical protein